MSERQSLITLPWVFRLGCGGVEFDTAQRQCQRESTWHDLDFILASEHESAFYSHSRFSDDQLRSLYIVFESSFEIDDLPIRNQALGKFEVENTHFELWLYVIHSRGDRQSGAVRSP